MLSINLFIHLPCVLCFAVYQMYEFGPHMWHCYNRSPPTSYKADRSDSHVKYRLCLYDQPSLILHSSKGTFTRYMGVPMWVTCSLKWPN